MESIPFRGSLLRQLPAWLPALPAAAILGLFLRSDHWATAVLAWVLLVAVFSLRWEPGLYLSILAIPLAFVYRRFGLAAISPLDVLITATFAGWAIHALLGRERGSITGLVNLLRHLSGIDRALLAFAVVAMLSVLVAQDVGLAFWDLRLLVLEPLLLYILVRANRLGTARLLLIADLLVISGAVAALVGLYHFAVLDYVERAEGVRRILSLLYDTPNHLALFLGRIFPIGLSIALFGRTGHRRALHALSLVPIVVALYLAFSRGAWLLGLPVPLLFLGVMRGPRARRFALGGVALLLLALIPVAGTARFASLLDPAEGTSGLRLLLWGGTVRLIADNLLLGVGIGNFVAAYPRYMLPGAWREPVVYHAHNVVLDSWSALGLPGLAVFAWLQVAFWRRVMGLYRSVRPGDVQALTLGLMASMVNFLAHGLVDTGFFLTDLAFVFVLTLALTERLSLDAARAGPRLGEPTMG